MSQKKIALGIVFYLLFSAGSYNYPQDLPKYDMRGNLTENYSSQGIRFFLSSSKSRYYSNEPILVNCHIKNEGLYPVTLYFNNDIFKNFTFVVRNQSGQSMPLKSTIFKNTEKKGNNHFFGNYTATDFNSRAIVLQPEESIVKSFDFNKMINLENPDSSSENISIMAYFYPNPEQANMYYISSENEYIVRLDMISNLNQKNMIAQDTLPTRELKISPKEVIYLMLTAEYEKNWLDYFKYVDLQEIIRDYPDFARKYMRSSREYQGLILEDFKKYLMTNARHKLINFEVVKQSVNKENATVNVRAMREIDGFDRDFLYTYYLSPKGSLWQVSGIEAQLLK